MKGANARTCALRTRTYAGKPQQLEIGGSVSNAVTHATKDYMVMWEEESCGGLGDALSHSFPVAKEQGIVLVGWLPNKRGRRDADDCRVYGIGGCSPTLRASSSHPPFILCDG